MKTVLIYSGGMDSTTLLYKLLSDGDTVETLSFNYGQRHKKELLSAKRICALLKVPHRIIDIRKLQPLMEGSSLTSDIPVPEGHYQDKTMRSTVVPNRNMIFVSLAMARAVTLKFDRIALAVHAGDHAIYPDCRPAFIEVMQQAGKVANYEKIGVYAPFLNKTKGQIARIGAKLQVPFELTWTCYKGLSKPCGRCGACGERLEALEGIEV